MAEPPAQLRIAILFSGGGSTLENLVESTRDGRLPEARVIKAISSRAEAGGIDRCRRLGVPCEIVARREHPDVAAHSEAVFARLDEKEIDLICLAGWMSLLALPRAWKRQRVMNVHPSLLPSFGGPGMYGRRVHEAVLTAGARMTGCTVHWVTDDLDAGPVIAQRLVPVEPGDTPDTLADRVQQAERELYPEAIRQIACDLRERSC